MEEVDFSICTFIKETMWYFTYEDFCNNRYILRRLYKTLNKNEKQFYKWYVYANIHMGQSHKNAIWDYLNEYDISGLELMKLKK